MAALVTLFLMCIGYFDQQMRQNLFSNWCTHMQQAMIQFRPDLARTEVRSINRKWYADYGCFSHGPLLMRWVVADLEIKGKVGLCIHGKGMQ